MANYTKTVGKDAKQLAHGLGWFSIGLGLAEALVPSRLANWLGVPEQEGVIRLLGAREVGHGIGILSQSRPAGAVWSRVAGDAIDLACLGAAFASPRANKGRLAFATAAVLGVAALDLYTAQKLTYDRAVRVQSITVNRSPEEVYNFWRDFQNLPRFMSHLESVQVLDSKRSHWVAKAPAGARVEWDAEITVDRPNELITWRSLEGADVPNSGVVHFQSAPGGRGTEIHVTIVYEPPAGQFGAWVARLFGEEPGQQVKGDLYRFKQVMETGEVVNSDSSIHQGPYPHQPPAGKIETLEGGQDISRRAA